MERGSAFSNMLRKPMLSTTERGCKSEATKDTTASVISFCFPPSLDFHFLADWDCNEKPVKVEMAAC